MPNSIQRTKCSLFESIPKELRAKDVKDLDLPSDILPIERALGVMWCIQNNTIGFKVVMTRNFRYQYFLHFL